MWAWGTALGCALAMFAAFDLSVRRHMADTAYWRGRAAAAEDKAGAACSPVYGVWWTERTCTGWAGWLPGGVQGLICPSRLRAWRGDSLERARERAQALGPQAGPVMLLEERGVKEREIGLSWRAEIAR